MADNFVLNVLLKYFIEIGTSTHQGAYQNWDRAYQTLGQSISNTRAQPTKTV